MSKTIAIIGGGFSGTTLAIHLSRMCPDVGILLIEAKGLNTGTGLAYGTMDDNLVLNVPAGNMSMFHHQPDHFKEYCEKHDGAVGSTNFVSRRLYGQYLMDCLEQEMMTRPGIGIVTSYVTDVLPIEDGRYKILMAKCHPVEADYVVFATGHQKSRPMRSWLPAKTPENLNNPTIIDNPWSLEQIDEIPHSHDVMIAGTGHTAVDTFFRLESSGAKYRTAYMVSRRGLLPNGHRPVGEFKKDNEVILEVEKAIFYAAAPCTLRKLVRVFRTLPKQLGVDWRDVINAVRPLIPKLWSQVLTEYERRQFLRHVVPYWDVHRHRLAPAAYSRLKRAIRDGRLRLIKGRIQSIGPTAVKIHTCRSSKEFPDRDFSLPNIKVVINCTGPNYDLHAKSDSVKVTFLQQMSINGYFKQDELKQGLIVNDSYQVCPGVNPQLYYIGPMLKAKHWEAIAVPELRVHAFKLAQIISNSMGFV